MFGFVGSMAMDSAGKYPFVKVQVAPPSIVLSVPKSVPRYTMFGSFGAIAMDVAPTPSIPLSAGTNVTPPSVLLRTPPKLPM